MEYHNTDTLNKYWGIIERTKKHFGKILSYNTKRLWIDRMKMYIKKEELNRLPIVSYFNILKATKGFKLIDLSKFKLTERTIKDEIIKWFNLGLLKQGYSKFPDFNNIEDKIYHLNRHKSNFEERKTKVDKLYAKRAIKYFNDNKVNNPNVELLYFIFLSVYHLDNTISY